MTDLVEAAIEASRVERLIASDDAAKGTPLREALAALLAREHFGEIFDVAANTKDVHSWARVNMRARADKLLALGIAEMFTPDRDTLRETLRQARLIDQHDDLDWVEQPADTLLDALTDRKALEAAATVVRDCAVCLGDGWFADVTYDGYGTPEQVQADCDHEAEKRNRASAVLARHKSCPDCGGIGVRFTMIYRGEFTDPDVGEEHCTHDTEGNRVA